ncbi:Agrin-like protein [Dinothrombium tinctorium]|uniref:Agrin-like protein n=1 Tax=Dinothrombium tinctorium TaxID=1965070 RepID=A0A3S3SL14_9ACAR|nr:Agrin-like protein [Dinothrombium tinctorium]
MTEEIVDAINAIWIMTSTFVIFLMQTGFALLESGSCSAKNQVNLMMKNVLDVIIGGFIYWCVGYGLQYGNSDWSNPFCGWIWRENGFLNTLGSLDCCGAAAVHFLGGIASLIAAIKLKPRLDRYANGWRTTAPKPDNAVNSIAGAIAVHAGGGFWGTIAVGLSADFDENVKASIDSTKSQRGLFKSGSFKLLGNQILALLAICVWTVLTAWLILTIINMFVSLRMSKEEEVFGADLWMHGLKTRDNSRGHTEKIVNLKLNAAKISKRLKRVGYEPECQEKVPRRSQELPDVVLTGFVEQVYPNIDGGDTYSGSIVVKHVYRGPRNLQDNRITVEGFGDKNLCLSTINKRDTWIYYLTPISDGYLRLNASLQKINLQNLDRLKALVKDQPYRKATVVELPCETQYCKNNGNCVEEKTSSGLLTTARCECLQYCTHIFDPVCGSNWETFGNECRLRMESCKRGQNYFVRYPSDCQASPLPQSVALPFTMDVSI